MGALLGLMLAASVPLLLFLTWGHVHTFIALPGQPDHIVVRAFAGDVLPRSLRIELIALSSVVAVVAVIAVFRLVAPAALLICCAAMAAEIVAVGIESSDTTLFSSELTAPNVTNLTWGWATSTLVAAFVLSGLGLAVWLSMLVVRAPGKKCPDCAERVRQGAVDCPHCGYSFPLQHQFRRCEACERPVKAEARVCRYCHHRFDEPVVDTSER